jgi:hypothetical protein
VYEGFKGISSMHLLRIERAKAGADYLFFAADVEPMNKDIQEFYGRIDPKRKAKRLNVLRIAHKRLKPLFDERVKKGYMKVKYVDFAIPPNMAILDDMIDMTSWGEKPVGFLINSKQLAEKYRKYFYEIWNSV